MDTGPEILVMPSTLVETDTLPTEATPSKITMHTTVKPPEPELQAPMLPMETQSTISEARKAANDIIIRSPAPVEGDNIVIRSPPQSIPAIAASKGRGRGGIGRARGKSRSSLSSTKARKRKRNGDDDESEPSSDEVCTPTALTTKSGRNVQRPTNFVPSANGSPVTATNGTATMASNGSARVYKKKRVWRRNAENAVCKSCLRGTSPASNMIVFCDGCNTPYHRWCHHPPIDQKVIDESDKEWYCRGCSRERVVPVPENELAHWVAAPGAEDDERRQFFMSLTPGTMVTLLMRATAMHTDLPIFAPEWTSRFPHRVQSVTSKMPTQPQHTTQIGQPETQVEQPAYQSTIYVQHDDEDEDEGYGAEEHPAHYVRPGKGLMSTLPPDREDEKHLVDEESSRGVFHHIYLIDGSTATPPASIPQGS